MKYLFSIFCLIFLACNTTKTVVKPKDNTNEIKGYKKYNPQTGQYEWVSEDPKGQVDTTKVHTNPKDVPIKKTENTPKGINRAIKVALILPFYADQNKDGEAFFSKSSWATNFYGGVKLALDSLIQKGISVDIRVFDDKASETELNKILLYEDVKNADLIIGPAGKSNLKLAANFAKSRGIPLVSPYNPSDDITSNNPNFIQINPSLKSHCEAIAKDIFEHTKSPNITIISRNKSTETGTYDYFISNLNNLFANINIHKITIDEETNGLSKTDLEVCFLPNRQNVIIIPSWSNEAFVAALLQKIENSKKGNTVSVYGMPQWIGFELLNSELLAKLNTKISSSNPLDLHSENTKQFKQLFYNKYSGLATDEAVVGYDITYIMINMLKKYGKEFPLQLGEKKLKGYTSYYDFKKISNNTIENNSLQGIQRIENKSIKILEFKDGGFRE